MVPFPVGRLERSCQAAAATALFFFDESSISSFDLLVEGDLSRLGQEVKQSVRQAIRQWPFSGSSLSTDSGRRSIDKTHWPLAADDRRTLSTPLPSRICGRMHVSFMLIYTCTGLAVQQPIFKLGSSPADFFILQASAAGS